MHMRPKTVRALFSSRSALTDAIDAFEQAAQLPQMYLVSVPQAHQEHRIRESEIEEAIAVATGERLAVIRSHGFRVADPMDVIHDPIRKSRLARWTLFNNGNAD